MLISNQIIITSKWRLNLAFLLILLFILKSGIVLWAVPKFSELRPDSYEEDRFVDEYHFIATNILEGNGYREYPDSAQTLFRLPGYVMILVAIFYFFGKNLFVIKLLNILLSICTGYIIIRLYQKVTGHSRGAFFAALVFLFHPGTILCETRSATEIVFTFFVALFILTLYQAVKTEKPSQYFISGCVLGLSALVRSTPILFPFFLFIFLLFSRKSHRTIKSVTANVIIMVCGMLLILSPWAIRNYLVSGDLIFTTSQPGSVAQETLFKIKNLQTGKQYYELCLEASGERALWAKEQGFDFRDTFQLSFYSTKDEIAFNKYLSKRVREEYLKKPSLFIKSLFYNFWWFWFQGRTTTSTVINTILTIPLLLLAGAGILMSFKSSLNIFPMTLFIFYYVLVHVPLMGYGRFHFPLIPLLAVLVCVPFFHRDRGAHQ
jgi:4-amino-4-deoxy-L-arabinose transferase-like glycosyltransferase